MVNDTNSEVSFADNEGYVTIDGNTYKFLSFFCFSAERTVDFFSKTAYCTINGTVRRFRKKFP